MIECPTCAERGYDNADYHRLHRAWCDSVAEIERLRSALKWLCEHAEDSEASRDKAWYSRLDEIRASQAS
jgi:hypothetical protein